MRGTRGAQRDARSRVSSHSVRICSEDADLTFDPRTYRATATELAGRVIAITGASGGMGRAVALACAAHGAQVILIGRNARKLEAVHAEIEAAGGPEPIIALLDLE